MTSFWSTTRTALLKPGRISGSLLTAAPTLVFVVVSARSRMNIALIAAGLCALGVLTVRLVRRESPKQAVIGLLTVAACAAIAALTGEARGFFLLPALLPAAIVVVCVVSVLVRRPLTGLILNRIAGGPANWFEVRALRRVYSGTTLACAAVNIVNGALQAVFYVSRDTLLLTLVHLATGPIFAVIVAFTVVSARRVLARVSGPADERT